MIALSDLGWWVRYVLDNRASTSGKDLEIASDMVGWDYLSEVFIIDAGTPSVHKRITLDQWFECLTGAHQPIANEEGDRSTTIWQSFSGVLVSGGLGAIWSG